ncbi:MAG: tetratricopeptide repeat protein [Magnetococcales bacterium]|nr:tetratricopeptide repeat protein [Magnetococcales bacterium]
MEHLQKGELSQAETLLNQILAVKPDHPNTIHLLGVVAHQRGENTTAIEKISKAIELNGKKAPFHLNLGLSYQETGRFKKAAEAFQKSIDLDPEEGDGYYLLGSTLKQLKHSDLAAKALIAAIKHKPDHYQAYNELGTILNKRKQHDQAITAYKSALEIKPDFPEALSNMGNALSNIQLWKEATVFFQKSIEIDPNFVYAHYNLGLAFEALGQKDEAAAAFQNAVRINPDFADGFFSLGNLLQNGGKLKLAAASYLKAVKADPKHFKAFNNLALADKTLGMTEEALGACRQALRIRPKFFQAYNNLGSIFMDVGRLQEALSACRNSLSINPDYADAHFNIGGIQRKMGDTKKALISFQKTLDPDHPQAAHIINSLEGRTTPTAPRPYVQRLFDGYAKKFDSHLVKQLEYDIPARLRQQFDRAAGDQTALQNAVDLGCGTGLVGAEFRNIVTFIAGIDLAPKMLAQAHNKKLYDALVEDNLVEGMAGLERKFDLFLSADVFIYVGQLEPVFQQVQQCAAENAWFVFSTERTQKQDYLLRESGRYAHSRAYINRLATEIGFDMVSTEPVHIRKESEQWIEGDVFVLRKGSG